MEKHNFGDEKKEICLTNEDPLPQDLLNFVRLAAMTEEEVIINELYFIIFYFKKLKKKKEILNLISFHNDRSISMMNQKN